MHGSLSIGGHHHNASSADAFHPLTVFVGLYVVVPQLLQEKIAGFIIGDSARAECAAAELADGIKGVRRRPTAGTGFHAVPPGQFRQQLILLFTINQGHHPLFD